MWVWCCSPNGERSSPVVATMGNKVFTAAEPEEEKHDAPIDEDFDDDDLDLDDARLSNFCTPCHFTSLNDVKREERVAQLSAVCEAVGAGKLSDAIRRPGVEATGFQWDEEDHIMYRFDND